MTGNDDGRTNVAGVDAAAHGAGAPPTRVYASDRITVQWFAKRCIHSGNSVRALPGVSNARRRPWVDVHAADADAIGRAVLGCPSGALRYVRHDGGNPGSPVEADQTPIRMRHCYEGA